MKALSILPKYAMQIAREEKVEEYRTWKTDYRGPLLICSSNHSGVPGSIPGHAICVVDLVDIRKDGEKDYAWILDDVRLIKPVPVKGKLHIYDVDIEPEYAPDDENITDEEIDNWLNTYFYPKMKDMERQKDGSWDLTEKAKKRYKLI